VRDRVRNKDPAATPPLRDVLEGIPGSHPSGSDRDRLWVPQVSLCRLRSCSFPHRSMQLGVSMLLGEANKQPAAPRHVGQQEAVLGAPRARRTASAGTGPGWIGASAGCRSRPSSWDRSRRCFPSWGQRVLPPQQLGSRLRLHRPAFPREGLPRVTHQAAQVAPGRSD
jgi:hypothetical protein